MAQRKIVFNRIARVEPAEPVSQLLGHPPAPTLAADQTDGPAHVLNVCVNWHEEFCRWNLLPVAKVQMVASNHPTEEEKQALAGASLGRAWEKVEEAAGRPTSREHGTKVLGHNPFHEAVERWPHIGIGIGVAEDKVASERSMGRKDSTHGQAEGGNVSRPVETIAEAAELIGVPVGIKVANELSRVSPHDLEDALDFPGEEVDPTVRETGGEERHYLPVPRVVVATGKLDGVMGKPPVIIKLSIKLFQWNLKPVERLHESVPTIATRGQACKDEGDLLTLSAEGQTDMMRAACPC